MAVHVDNLVLEHLRGLRAQGDLVLAELREVKHRLTALETAVISVRRDAVQTDAELARQQSAFDRLADRVERIERRLEILP